jgi:tRNA(Ile)-lysidine synthase
MTPARVRPRTPSCSAEPKRSDAAPVKPRSAKSRAGASGGTRGTPSLTTLVRRALESETALSKGSCVLVATSGGPDSMALLSVLARIAARFELRVIAHGVDHGLRAEACEELDLAAREAARLGVPFTRSKLEVKKGGNVQERAREARWATLVDAAKAARAVIATAHHADDRAETVLARVLRGSGWRGLAVLPPRAHAPGAVDVVVVRPMLRARRADVLAHLERENIAFATDPSNVDRRYVRARIRAELLPLLESFDPNVVAHLNALADEAGSSGRQDDASWMLPRATQEALARLARDGSPTARVWLPGGVVAQLDPAARPPARRRRARGDSTA